MPDKDQDWAGVIIGLFAFFFALYVYFLPSLVARNRRHHNAFPIAILNTFFGWTGIGWVGALIWAFTSPPPQPRDQRVAREHIERPEREQPERQLTKPVILPKAHLPEYLFDKKRHHDD